VNWSETYSYVLLYWLREVSRETEKVFFDGIVHLATTYNAYVHSVGAIYSASGRSVGNPGRCSCYRQVRSLLNPVRPDLGRFREFQTVSSRFRLIQKVITEFQAGSSSARIFRQVQTGLDRIWRIRHVQEAGLDQGQARVIKFKQAVSDLGRVKSATEIQIGSGRVQSVSGSFR
jgi:hypothetical protein